MRADLRLPSPAAASRVAGLDIVRALAILLVLLSHCGSVFSAWEGWGFPWWLAVGGFYGVTLFFVLSGFLIGSILLDMLARRPGLRDWMVFMARRWLRTLPLYYLCILVLSLVWRPRFWEPGAAALWHDLPWYLTMSQNLAWQPVDQWFDVSWSLAVEEWFYLAFSAILLACARLIRCEAALALTIGAFLIVPLLLRAALPADIDWGQVTSKVVVLRLDAIAWGVLMAWWYRSVPAIRKWSGILCALGLICAALNWYDAARKILHMSDEVWKPLVFDMSAVSFALCLPFAAQWKRTMPALERSARALSAQSYALYLIHLDILGITGFYKDKYDIPASLAIVTSLVEMFGLSWLSYRYFERPILSARPAQSSPGRAGFA